MTTPVSTPALHLHDAARGLAQQMILWGHDVRHRSGNALVRFGLERTPSPGLTGTSCYSMKWEDGLIELHGAVASWTAPAGNAGCLFARDRAHLELWHGPRPPVPGREAGSLGTPEQRWAASQPLLRWLARYEDWAFDTLGPDWRTHCWRAIKRLPHGKAWLPPHAARQWWHLALLPHPPRAKSFARSLSRSSHTPAPARCLPLLAE